MMENERAFPFDSVEDAAGNPDRLYSAEDFAGYFAQFLGNGVYPNPATNLAVHSLNSNMVLTVQPGSAFINGYGYINKAPLQIALSTADGAYNRIDLIVVQLNHIDREIRVVYKQGVPAANPAKPELVRNDDVHELQLAQVTVRSGVQMVTQADVLDTRLNGSVCGVVTAVVQSVDTTQLFAQYQTYLNQKISEWNATQAQQGTAFREQMQAQQETFALQLTEQQTGYEALRSDFMEWFNSAKVDIQKLQVFDFDNLCSMVGYTYQSQKQSNPTKYTETIANTADGAVFATRTSAKAADGSWTIITTCPSQMINTKIVYTKTDGIWKGVLTDA